ncbi:MAG: sulfatase-like hydrolase/transferase [Muribaculaceae bacterium]|nr:sulfatase-like hydrolase/transferase [Muribaculaceae bacterium]
MKLKLNYIKSFFANQRWLALWTIIGLTVPSVWLSLTEAWTLPGKFAGVLTMAGVYTLLMSLSRRPGRMVWYMFPLLFFAAFQMVLMYLYGDGVIAVDMYLNVLTTSVSEVSELLLNLIPALLSVVVLYLVPLIWGATEWRLPHELSERFLRGLRRAGWWLTGAGAACMAACMAFVPRYNAVNETFPLNAIYNLWLAVERTGRMEHYHESSAGFSYHARSTADPAERELYIIVVGETGRAADWQLSGYRRPTNPLLSHREGLTYFDQTFSESNTTHKSVPMILSYAESGSLDSIPRIRSVITAFREAGYATAFLSAQTPNRSYTQFFGEEADTTIYIGSASRGTAAHDGSLLPNIENIIARGATKQLIVVHTYGSHYKYNERYPRKFARFTPDQNLSAKADNRRDLVNAYDNTILYTDYILSRIIDMADGADCRSAVLYSTDHGEDIFDDSRGRFLHASPTPTAYQLHIPMLVWLSPRLRAESPDKAAQLDRHAHSFATPQKSIFMTLVDVAQITTPYYNSRWALTSGDYREPRPTYVNDHNRQLPWSEVAFKPQDKVYFRMVLHDKSLSPE